jgi:aryl-phospho-beta-D-glucosidase BglC (GH1 family)
MYGMFKGKRIIWLLVMLLLLAITTTSIFAYVPPGFFSCRGQNIVDAEGKPFLSQGFGLGGWLVPEGYMLKMPGEINSPTRIKKAITALIGPKNTQEFYRRYEANYVAEADIQAIAGWGVNTIRLPFNWKMLLSETEPHVYLENGFQTMDRLIGWCKKYGLLVILDMHCAPGGQNANNISDSDNEARLWTQSSIYQPLTIDLWKTIAARYADEKWVLGYDLLNEPVMSSSGHTNVELRDLYIRITQAIRKVDTNHLLFIEGGFYATDFSLLAPPWDDKMVYSFHMYPPPTDPSSIQKWLDLSAETNTPLWFGESGENTITTYEASIAMLEKNNIGWSWWTHKKINTTTCPYSSPIRPGYQKVLDYWAGTGRRPSKDQATAGLLEQADYLALGKCDYDSFVMRSICGHLLPPLPPAPIPGQIEAESYTKRHGIQVRTCAEGGLSVSLIDADAWLEYHVNVQATGKYRVEYRVASPYDTAKVDFRVNGATLATTLIPNTGNGQTWTTVTDEVTLNAGEQTIRLYAGDSIWHINWFRFTKK